MAAHSDRLILSVGIFSTVTYNGGTYLCGKTWSTLLSPSDLTCAHTLFTTGGITSQLRLVSPAAFFDSILEDTSCYESCDTAP